MYKKFSDLLQQRGLRAADVSRGTGINQTVFSEWKKGKSDPKFDKLQKIAKYFNVPVEYFSNEEENLDIKKLTPINDDRRELYEDLERLSSDDLGLVKGLVKGLLAKHGRDE